MMGFFKNFHSHVFHNIFLQTVFLMLLSVQYVYSSSTSNDLFASNTHELLKLTMVYYCSMYTK